MKQLSFLQAHWRKVLATLAIALLTPTLAWATTYADTQGHWAVMSIEKAQSLNLVSGYEDGSFRPDANVTRAEFIAFLNRAHKVKPASPDQPLYADVAESAWYANDVRAAQAKGYIGLFDTERLQPNVPITREEVARLTDDLLAGNKAETGPGSETDLTSDQDASDKAKDGDSEAFAKTAPDSEKERRAAAKALTFIDSDTIAPECRNAVADLVEGGYLSGYPDKTFRPQNKITRAEAISIILRSIHQNPTVAIPGQSAPVQEDGKTYLIDQKSGLRIEVPQSRNGRLTIGDRTYWLNPDASLKLGWIQENGHTYYATETNGLARGWQQIDGKTYYFSPYSYERFENGVFSTGTQAHWFGQDGVVLSGNRPGGHKGKPIYWAPPTAEELSNAWLKGPDTSRRFLGQAVANYAAKREGLPFKWFGCDLNDPSGVYCCGAVYSAYKEMGIATMPPSASNIRADKGYRMVKDQYLTAPNYGGKYIPSSFSQMWPGDVSYSFQPSLGYGYNHAALFLGFNNGRPIVAHATLADGFIVEPADIITSVWGYAYINGVRYV